MRLLDVIKKASWGFLFLLMFVLIGFPLIAATTWALLHPLEHFEALLAAAILWLTMLCGFAAAKGGD